jgi:condensation domain-containing protein
MGERLMVDFEGGDTGVEVLSWGQRELWRVMEEKHTWLPIGAVQPLAAGTTVDDAVADLRFAMSRYPSMRTRLRLDPDGPRQVVASSGTVALEVVEAADGDDPAAVAQRVWLEYWRADYDFVTEWPVRMAVIRHRDALTHRAWVMCHLVTDGGGSRVIIDELARRDTSGSGAAMSAVEQARWQRSPAGQRQCDVALRYWEKTLRTIPARRYPVRTERPEARYWQASVDFPALYLAVRAIAARTGVEVSSVLLAMFAVALRRVTGVNPVLVQLVASNRFRPGLASTVSPIMQDALCTIDVPDATVDEAVAHTRRRAMTAYKYAYCDPYRRDEVIARVNEERGERVDISCFFNDRRLKTREQEGAAPPPSPEQVAAAPLGSFEWKHKQDYQIFDEFFVNINDVPDTVSMTVQADIHHLSPVDVEACIHGMQKVAVAAALDPATTTYA